ncbi:Cactin [Bienertia sinuspersici]
MAKHDRSSRRDKPSSSRRTSHRHFSDDDSSSDEARRRNRRRSHRRKRSSSPETSEDSGVDKTHKSRKVSEDAIKEYLAKKAAKKAMNVAKKMKTQTVSGYSNDSNPFGDSNLNEKFVWRKKIEKDVAHGVPLDEYTVKAEKKRQKERMAEIEKVKKRREERALEKAQREEEMMMLQRERSRAEADDFEKKEEEFHFDQSKVRSRIRLREGRMKPIDVLTKYLDDSDEFDVELDEPYMVFKALMVVCEWELGEARRKDTIDRARVRGEQPPAELLAEERGLHSSIETDVKNFLEGKSYKDLVGLQSQIESGMQIHAKILRKHLHRLEQPLRDDNLKSEEDEMEEETEDARAFSPEPIAHEEALELEAEDGSFSPQLLHGEDNEEAIDPDEDRVMLEKKRLAVVEEQQKRMKEAMASTKHRAQPEDDFEIRAKKTMGAMEEGDVVFGSGAEVNLDSQVYWWHDKYRPRKPKYFNRVHTGYEWNKYNQTHYDHDNPPPKIVQGYKFNIFYPDLVDKTKAPTYFIEKDGDSSETCIIRFHAGPPYEDIAFRIVNKEWEYSHKKGYKCTFERGILHVYFNFKRYRYRR